MRACIPREIVKLALQRNAAAVIVAHNHPSGVAEPSQADELITQRVKEALALVDIRLLDHIIVGDGVARVAGGTWACLTAGGGLGRENRQAEAYKIQSVNMPGGPAGCLSRRPLV